MEIVASTFKPSNRRFLVIGCGYVGLPLAQALRASAASVFGWVHTPTNVAYLEAESISPFVGDVSDAADWTRLSDSIEPFDCIVHCASSSRGGPEAYQRVFINGIKHLNDFKNSARSLFVSSSSVYAQTSGEWVDEGSPTEPTVETGRLLVQAEQMALASGAIVVRSAGIYGPGRSISWNKFLSGTAVLEEGGQRWMNQIHRNDLVSAIVRLIEFGLPGNIYNAVDDGPTLARDFYQWCSAQTQRPLPPEGPANPNRKRGLTNKRIRNSKLRALGWVPQYPSFREGLLPQLNDASSVPAAHETSPAASKSDE